VAQRAANTSKARADFEKAIRYLQYSDSLSASDEAKFLLGATSLTYGRELATEASKTKSCELSRQAQTAFADAQINLPRGGKFNPQVTGQYMGFLQQLLPVGEQLVKANCK
jgi:hypothetical protein